MKLFARSQSYHGWHPARSTLGILSLGFILSGCITSNGPVSSASNHSANHMVVIGVPMLVGGFGSAVPVSKDYMITAKHVAQLSWDMDVIHHPNCDLSLVKRASDYIPKWGLIYPDQPVSHHGHSVLGNKIKGKGKYLQDVIDTNTDCLYSLSDAPVMSGMSGGPVFNEQGEIAGITVAIVHNPEDLSNLRPAERYSQFVPATLIFDWLASLGIHPQSASPALASIQVSQYVTELNRQGQPSNTTSANRSDGSTNNALAPLTAQSNQAPAATSALRQYRTPVSPTFLQPQYPTPKDSSQEPEEIATTLPEQQKKQRHLLNQSGYNSLF
ncbi:S1C family serine protease [Photobacterium sanctipauli]|uniref:S1C family serine protease n=1 Tax=Photobacterium sanctipauli TaxID=1342794 RepID=UPI000B035AF3|nr:S1C family serine protease [Photobacterium sanctipauli]